MLSEDKLFATLDPTTRLLNLQDGQQILLTDTVGFIHKLPHHLIEAFKSTLEEAKYADYIIHVVDSSNPQAEMQMHVVYETLRELGVMGKKIITLFNKQDVPGACVLRDFKSDYSLKISARTGQGLEELGELLARFLAEDQIYMERIFSLSGSGQNSADPRIRTVALRRIYRDRNPCKSKGSTGRSTGKLYREK